MIEDNVRKLREEITQICTKIGRNASEITVIAVSKVRSAKEIKEVVESGITDIGESKVQEAKEKLNILRATNYAAQNIKWHMVGHLQTNKARDAVKIFDLIHSIDSVRLAKELDLQAAKIGKVQDILVQVKTSSEPAKFGFSPQETIEAVEKISKFKNLKVSGLMTIAPIVDEPEEARPYFRMLREIKDKITQALNPKPQALILSMGMSDDFKVAIEEGATMLRLGRVIFEG
ncbi:MAG: YggS family pyridoxal phosphate-dependent enzyme [Candidatus Omnitrophica bacterium]|nr:YggS family pyridoxal phosphate-dependent enzyme [Candidatus Omnitrophota bacterium]